jgi:hypothetical protein
MLKIDGYMFLMHDSTGLFRAGSWWGTGGRFIIPFLFYILLFVGFFSGLSLWERIEYGFFLYGFLFLPFFLYIGRWCGDDGGALVVRG